MDIDLKKEALAVRLMIYDEEVRITGDRYTSHSFMEKEMDKVWAKYGILAVGAMKFRSQRLYTMK